MNTQQVSALIHQVLVCDYVDVQGDGQHFFVTVISPKFTGLTRLQRHRLIKDGLKQQINSNELHALSITVAATPSEWQNQQKNRLRDQSSW